MNSRDCSSLAPVSVSRRVVTALLLVVALMSQPRWVLAGTTGGLTGSVTDAGTHAPVAGARVTVSSPSQTDSVTTDATGHFSFLTLTPDTYVVSAAMQGYQPTSNPGQVVLADTVETVSLRLTKVLQTIARVSSQASGSLVRSGTTADVYSINAAGQEAAGALGGGANLNTAYSAIATVPGAYVIPTQAGYLQTIIVRGGDYNQIGYEFDGIPVNRSFDNYPGSALSSLGSSEIQVYTGASPANSESNGLAGYINQVIKTGTYPGYGIGSLGLGTPTFYHRAAGEVGGSTPDRNFSYYLGVAGYNQSYRYIDNSNGAAYDWLGGPLNTTSSISYAEDTRYNLAPFQYTYLSGVAERDVVANVHIGIPHHNDAGRDDVQLLWDSSYLMNYYYNSTNDIASTACPGATSGAACANEIGLGQPVYVTTFGSTYPNGVSWYCPSIVGKTFSAAGLNAQSSCVKPYSFPSSGVPSGTPIPVGAGDTTANNQEIFKLQYTKNFSSNAFLRVYGYTYYSNWFNDGPQSTYALYAAVGSADYGVSSHSRGVSAMYQNQINAQNLLSLQGSYVTSTSLRDNNTFYSAGKAAVVVNAAEPLSGYCYGATGGAPINCYNGGNVLQMSTIQSKSVPALPVSCVNPLTSSTACTYLLAENGENGAINQVTPRFLSASLTDEFRPSDRFLLNVGLRLDSYTFIGANTDTGAARDMWSNAYNLDNCVDEITGLPYALAVPLVKGATCPADPSTGNAGSPAQWANSPANFTYNIWQPRVAGTYTINPNSVLRFSYGRYAQAPQGSFEQYNTRQEDLADYVGSHFYGFGRTSPGFPVAPPTSLNYDLSWEQHFKGTDVSLKMTPFLRQTQNQIQNFSLGLGATAITSGLNVGDQRSEGVEFQLQKGDFTRNGLSGQLSFAYTNSYVHYGTVASGKYGTTVITTTNQAISSYNAYTAACAPGGAFVGKIGPNHVPLCGVATDGSGNVVAAAPCYTTAGAPVYNCTKADVGNPYWNNPQSLIDPTQAFPTYDTFPGAVGSSASAFGVPYAATLVLNYKHDKLAVTPSFQFEGGGRYGYPESNPGINPAACPSSSGIPGILAGVTGANGGSRYNSLACGQLSAIPNTYTHVFDPLGAFTQPNLLEMNLQIKYDVSPHISLTGTIANLFNTCWGGTVAPWTYSGNGQVCGYIIGGFQGEVLPVGNAYNPPGYHGSIVQSFVKYPYNPILSPYVAGYNQGSMPLNLFVTAQIKL